MVNLFIQVKYISKKIAHILIIFGVSDKQKP